MVLFSALHIKAKKIRNQERKIGVPTSTITEQKRRAIKTFIILFVAIFFVFVPLSTLFVAKLFGSEVRTLLKLLAVDLFRIFVITDPIVILKNGDVREVFKVKNIVKSFLYCLKKKTLSNHNDRRTPLK